MGVLRCTDSFAYTDHGSGQNRVVRAGDLVDDGNPVVNGREQWFEPVDASVVHLVDRSVEQTTAAPGEKRAARKPAARKSSASGD